MKLFDIERFTAQYITERDQSLFKTDLEHKHNELKARIDGKAVLVIGGAGSIGSSFIKALLHFSPRKLYVIDISENGLTELTRDLRSSTSLNIPEDYKTYPINFGDAIFEKILKNEGPFEIVANFAAHKHVRSEKDHYSIQAMIENNVIKAKKLLDLLVQYPPERFFCVSTDKAANPVNVMGASKKLMEEVILAYSSKIPVTTARFANVAFSNGSLLAGFIERLMKRQPLSSPSDVKRYFVSPEESGQLCLLACILGESGDVFFPKLDASKMKTFSDIAKNFLREHHFKTDEYSSEQEARVAAALLTPDAESYPVYFFRSDTSGEKSFEEFFTTQEVLDLNGFAQLGVIKSQSTLSMEAIKTNFKQLESLFQNTNTDKSAIVKLLKEFVPNFEHIEKGKGLDEKM